MANNIKMVKVKLNIDTLCPAHMQKVEEIFNSGTDREIMRLANEQAVILKAGSVVEVPENLAKAWVKETRIKTIPKTVQRHGDDIIEPETFTRAVYA